MTTLYDVIGARPADDADKLKNAFRNAVKASHPDLHVDDPGAPTRFRQVVGAYAILRRAEQRAAYHRLLELERRQRRSHAVRRIVFDAVGVVGLAVVMAGGYTLFAHLSKPSIEMVKVVEMTAGEPAATAAAQPASPANTTDRAEPRDTPAGADVPNMTIGRSALASEVNRDDAPPTVDGGQASSATGTDAEVAKTISGISAPIDPNDAKIIADHLTAKEGIGPSDNDKTRSAGVELSSLQEDGNTPNPSSDSAKPNEKHGVKILDIKIAGKPRMVAKRQAINPPHLRQASLENKNASPCTGPQSCSSHAPPLFGIGF